MLRYIVTHEMVLAVPELPASSGGTSSAVPQSGEIESVGSDSIALWLTDTVYNEESFFIRHAYSSTRTTPRPH